MDNLQKALGLLSEQFGEFDNIKLMLGGGKTMTRDIVSSELLNLAEKLTSGEIVRGGMADESKFCEQNMAF